MISESITRLIVLMVTLCFILWLNATVFDATEIRTLVLFFLGAAGLEGGTGYLKNVLHKNK